MPVLEIKSNDINIWDVWAFMLFPNDNEKADKYRLQNRISECAGLEISFLKDKKRFSEVSGGEQTE